MESEEAFSLNIEGGYGGAARVGKLDKYDYQIVELMAEGKELKGIALSMGVEDTHQIARRIAYLKPMVDLVLGMRKVEASDWQQCRGFMQHLGKCYTEGIKDKDKKVQLLFLKELREMFPQAMQLAVGTATGLYMLTGAAKAGPVSTGLGGPLPADSVDGVDLHKELEDRRASIKERNAADKFDQEHGGTEVKH